MKNILLVALVLGCFTQGRAQTIKFVEYDLPNGLHVILHQDNTVPVVAVSVMYHVGSKNEVAGRTGFAHFFEHLLFEGSENIKRGEFMKIVSSHGGANNANTSQDRTFFYELFPSNDFKLGLWLESERMMHPVINEIGVKTQNEVVKEEKRLRFDNQPYGHLNADMDEKLFPTHPYNWPVIGSMKDIDAAKLQEFKDFFKTYYVPNNAVLSIAGDIDMEQAKRYVTAYFGEIPRGNPVSYSKIEEQPITKEMTDTAYDANIQIPLVAIGYRVPGMDSRDAKTMDMISYILSVGGSSKFYKKMVDEKKEAAFVGSNNYTLEDYGVFMNYATPSNGTPINVLIEDMDSEVLKLQTDLISEEEYKKIKNQMENNLVSSNSKMLGIAENLAGGYTFHHKNTGYTNEELPIIKSITRDDIRNAANKYLKTSSRVVLYTLPFKKPA
jgi:predicted Zn-dependent peptidase